MRSMWLHGLITAENSNRKDGQFDIEIEEPLHPDTDVFTGLVEYNNGVDAYYTLHQERIDNGNI